MDHVNVLQPSRSHAFVTFNNQHSVLLSMYVDNPGLLCLLHDNRIFAFKKEKAPNASDVSPTEEQNVILNLLTTPKYRAMSAMYVIFRLLDNLSFLIIIVRSLMGESDSFDTAPQLSLLGAIGLEIFYDVIMYTSNYWFLKRLSLYIGMLLFGGYYGIVLWKNANGEYKDDDFEIIIIVLTIRLVVFALEEIVDYVIDRELHNDLLILTKARQVVVNQGANDIDSSDDESNLLIVEPPRVTRGFMYETRLKLWWYLDVTNYVKMPPDTVYKGSLFAWGPMSVFTKGVWRKKPFLRWNFLLQLTMSIPILLTFICGFIIIALCSVAAVMPVILIAISCCTCRLSVIKERLVVSNFWKELSHF